jgi:large subunit ribosomal protein L4
MSNLVVVKREDIPQELFDINPHNLYIYCKAYAANLRANSANTKNRSEVSGGGKKPFRQKGGGRARQGSIRAPQFRGGGVVFGPTNNKNYTQKVNKKQKRLAFLYAIAQKVAQDKLFVVDNVEIVSGKTKDAKAFRDQFNTKDLLVVKDTIDEKTFLAFRNLKDSYLVDPSELNPYLVAVFDGVVFEKSVWENLLK